MKILVTRIMNEMHFCQTSKLVKKEILSARKIELTNKSVTPTDTKSGYIRNVDKKLTNKFSCQCLLILVTDFENMS